MYRAMHNNCVMPDGSPERFDAAITGTDFKEHKGFDDGITKYKINPVMERDIIITVQFRLQKEIS